MEKKTVRKCVRISKGLMDSYQNMLDNILHRDFSEDVRLFIMFRVAQSRDPTKLEILREELKRSEKENA